MKRIAFAIMVATVFLAVCTTPSRSAAAALRRHSSASELLAPGSAYSVPEIPWWWGWRPSPPPRHRVVQHVVIGGDVLFETGLAILSPAAQTQLFGVLRLAKTPGARVVIAGYTDNVPVDIPGGNLMLSRERATAVVRWMEHAGVPARCLAAYGYGADHPVATNSTAAGRAQNRRVEITVTT